MNRRPRNNLNAMHSSPRGAGTEKGESVESNALETCIKRGRPRIAYRTRIARPLRTFRCWLFRITNFNLSFIVNRPRSEGPCNCAPAPSQRQQLRARSRESERGQRLKTAASAYSRPMRLKISCRLPLLNALRTAVAAGGSSPSAGAIFCISTSLKRRLLELSSLNHAPERPLPAQIKFNVFKGDRAEKGLFLTRDTIVGTNGIQESQRPAAGIMRIIKLGPRRLS